jgi:hypothetical protein
LFSLVSSSSSVRSGHVGLESKTGCRYDAIFADNLEALKAALRIGQSESALTFQVPGVAGGGLRRINAKPRRLKLPIEQRFFYRQPIASVEFFASDPRIYDDAEQQATTALAETPTGLTWDLSWNLSWGTPGDSGSIFAVNAGTFPTPAVFRIDGPVTNPSIENITTGKRSG